MNTKVLSRVALGLCWCVSEVGRGSGVGWGLQSPDFLTLLLSDTCERSVGSLRLSTLLCNHKVQMTPIGCLKSSLSRAEPVSASSVRSEEKSIKTQPDQKDAQSQDTICTHLGLLMTGEHCGVVYYMRLTYCQQWQRRLFSYTKK